MGITASLVKELRERTGAGMMECKNALVASEGDIEVAIENMRKSGTAKAAKKAGRIASEGVIAIKTATDSKSAVLIEVNSETDFVARDENFLQFVNHITESALATKATTLDALLNLPHGEGRTVEEARLELIAKIGENISIRRIEYIESDGAVGAYLHGGRIGVITSISSNNVEIAKDLAMHIAASSPQYVAPENVPDEMIEKEKTIFKAQALSSGKPEAVIEKMVVGRIKKFLAETTLVGQDFVKDPSITVEKLLSNAGTQVKTFVRFEVGEGIEKKVENFAEEVMAQARGV